MIQARRMLDRNEDLRPARRDYLERVAVREELMQARDEARRRFREDREATFFKVRKQKLDDLLD